MNDKGIRWVLGTAIVASSVMPSQIIFAESYGSVAISSVSQGSSKALQPGDRFSLSVQVEATSEGEAVWLKDGNISGEGIDVTHASFNVEGDPCIKEKIEQRKVVISGLVYKGGSKEVSFEVNLEDGNGIVINSASEIYTLKAKTNEDLAESVTIKKQNNLLVKSGMTQKVEVRITNESKFTINQAEATISLNEKVKGITFTSATGSAKNIAPGESQPASFSVKVDEGVKAGIYPATVTVNGQSYTVNLQVDSHITPSIVEVGVGAHSAFTENSQQAITFSLKNIGDREAKNVRVEVTNTENLSIVGGSNVKYITSIGSKETQSITLNLKAVGSLKSGSIALPIKLTYLSSEGEEKEDTQYIYLNTTSGKTTQATQVSISNVASPNGVYGVNQNFGFKFNIGSKNGAKNVKVTVKGDEGIVPKSQNMFWLSEIKAGQSLPYEVSFAATREAVSSAHPIEILVEYVSEEEQVSMSQYGSVTISNPEKDKADDPKDEETNKNTPKVIIGQYSVNPIVVKAGENFELEIGFLNTHKSEAVHNLKASLKVVEQGENNTGSVFTPVGASNTFYISDLAPQEMMTKKITMYTIPSASPKTYEISLEMDYENDKGEEIKAAESLGIPVEQKTKVEVGELFVGEGQVGIENSLSATLYNTGKTDVSNMMVHVEGEGFKVLENKVFIGNFEKQGQETYEVTLIPEQEGTLSGTLVIDYEDPTGAVQQIREDFTLEVLPGFEMEEWEEFPMPTPEEETTSHKTAIIAGIGLVLVLGIAGLVRRKHKKEKMMNDED